MANPTRNRMWLAARVTLVVVLLIGLGWWVDWSSLVAVAARLPVGVVLGMLMLSSGSRWVCSTRWNLICGGLMKAPGVAEIFRIGLLAEFVNLWVPSSLGGEATRIWSLRPYGDVARAAVSVGVDRVLGLFGLVLSLLPVAFLIDLPFPAWVVPMGVLIVACSIGLALGLRDRIAGVAPWAAALAGLSAPRVLAALTLSSLAPWFMVAEFGLFFSWLHPLSVGAVAAFVLVTRFGRAVPVSVFGVNSVEGSMLILGELFGIPREIVALAVAMNMSDKLFHSMLGGVVELLLHGREGLRALGSVNQ